MPGKIKQIIEHIVRQRAGNDAVLIDTTKTKLILKGINPDRFTVQSADDPAVIEKLKTIAAEMGVRI